MFSGGPRLRERLSPTICLQWWNTLTGQEVFTEDLTFITKKLTLEIANLLPNVVHIHHEIEPNLGLGSFFFTITRSPEGLVSVVTDRKPFAKHEHLDRELW